MKPRFDVDFARRANAAVAEFDQVKADADVRIAEAEKLLVMQRSIIVGQQQNRMAPLDAVRDSARGALLTAGVQINGAAVTGQPPSSRPFDAVATEVKNANAAVLDITRRMSGRRNTGTLVRTIRAAVILLGITGLTTLLIDAIVYSQVHLGDFNPDHLFFIFMNSLFRIGDNVRGIATARSKYHIDFQPRKVRVRSLLEVANVVVGPIIAFKYGFVSRFKKLRVGGMDAWQELNSSYADAAAIAQQFADTDLGNETNLRDRELQDAGQSVAVAKNKLTNELSTMRLETERRGTVLDAHCPTWDDSRWRNWQEATSAPADLPIGGFVRQTPAGPIVVPGAWSFPGGRGITIVAPSQVTDRMALATDLACRILATVPAGKARFRFFDPVGLGRAVAPLLHLGDHDENLVGTKVWTEPAQVEAELGRITDHIEMVIQKYLRGTYSTIEQHNADAGEVAEAYLFPMYIEAPVGLSEVAIRRLTAIAEGGPRCGVYPMVVVDPQRPLPYGTDLTPLFAATDVILWDNGKWRYGEYDLADWSLRIPLPLPLEVPPPGGQETLFSRIVGHVGRAARATSVVEVDNSGVLAMAMRALANGIAPDPLPQVHGPVISDQPTSWWQGSTASFLSAPIGRSGASSVQCMTLGRGTAQHSLVAGLTGSGKSTLLHAVILNLCMLYSPHELELYLLDFKKGVEFKPYATLALPHARVVAIESEREFGLSVLRGLDAELTRRGEMFRATGVDDLASYRSSARTVLSRILMIIDEFHELFSEDDRLANEAGLILDRLVRQGRGFGIHLMLGSQSLAGLQGMGRATLGQIGVRIALQCDERDSMLILADDNTAARTLTRPGEGIYNASRGRTDGNQRFQTAWLTDEVRLKTARALRDRADAEGFARRPIVFEGSEVADVQNLIDQLAVRPLQAQPAVVWLGEPLSLDAPVGCRLRRQGGANLAIVGPDDTAAGLIASALSTIVPSPDAGQWTVIDFSPLDIDLGERLAKVADQRPGNVKIVRRRQLGATLSSHVAEIRRRIDLDDVRSQTLVLVLHQLHRARDLDAENVGIGSYDDDGGSEVHVDLNQLLHEVLRDGPEVGVHVVATADSYTRLQRRLGSASREMSMKVGFLMSPTDSQSMFDSEIASRLKGHQAVLLDEDANVMSKFRPFGFPL